LWQIVQSAAEALGAVANQKLIAKAVASMTPADVVIELDRLIISRSLFILWIGAKCWRFIKSEAGDQVTFSKILL
jgi:hypothetical protein